MKITSQTAKFFVFGGVLLTFVSRSASAQIIGNLNLYQIVGAYYESNPVVNNVVPVKTTSLPFHTTVSADDGHGGIISAVYDISDNGQAAAITVNCTAFVNGRYNNVSEGTEATTFTLLQPVYYIARLSCSINSASLDLTGRSTPELHGASLAGRPFTQSGIADPGPIKFQDAWDTNTETSNPINLTATYSLSIQFTAIPEPSTLAVIAAPAALLLTRRRNRRSFEIRCGHEETQNTQRKTG